MDDMNPFEELHEFVKGIMQCLGGRDLCRMKRVCKEWKKCATLVVDKRCGVDYFLFAKPALPKRNWEAIGDIPVVRDHFHQLSFLPEFMLVFGNLPLSRPCEGGTDLLYIRNRHMNPNCFVLSVHSSVGIIGTDSDSKTPIEYQNPKKECFASLMWSPIWNRLRWYKFNFSMEDFNRRIRKQIDGVTQRQPERFKELFGFDEPVKCLLLMIPSYLYRYIHIHQSQAFAMAGGICEEIFQLVPGCREPEELGLFGIAFCGGSNVRCYSTILEPSMKSKKSIGIRLSTMQRSVRLGQFANFAFMYACCGRGKNLFKKENVETSVFKELFPQVPIMGIFSLGEAGVNCDGQNEPNFNPNEIENVQLSYTTVIALIAVD